MIVTLTLNPAMDDTLILDRLVTGETNRVKKVLTDPGGKGINVSRVIRVLSSESLAMGFVSGSTGRFVEHALNERGIYDDFIHTPGQTRTNVVIYETSSSTTTNINEPGPEIPQKYVGELMSRLHSRLAMGSWLVAAGSVPPPIDLGVYAEVIDLAKRLGAHTALDSDGEALSKGVAANPDFIKPNWRELERLVGRTITYEDDVYAAAKHLHERGIRYVVVSMGKLGSIAVTDEGAWKAIPPPIKVGSTTGAGDSMVAAIVLTLSQGKPFVEGLRLGTAAGAATAENLGTQLCKPEEVERLRPLVQIEPVTDDSFRADRGVALS